MKINAEATKSYDLLNRLPFMFRSFLKNQPTRISANLQWPSFPKAGSFGGSMFRDQPGTREH